ncbi:hypothetical protein ACS0TY_026375 [Phlomoides rotata]
MEKEAQARVDVWKYALGFTEMRVIKCVVELGLPDVLESHGSPMTLSELSSAVGCPEGGLHRILRCLTHKGIFRKETNPVQSPVQYAQTPLSRLLTRDNMGPFVLVQAGRSQFGLSAKDLRAGKGSGTAPASTEDEMWSQDNVWCSKTSQQFLASHAKAATRAVIDNWPESFRGVSSLVDVGGRGGTAVGMLVKAFPWIRGMNFDLPHVVSEAPLLDGVEHVGGNMFEKIPQADAVMLMWILHDWSDELCIEILKKCKEAVPKDGGKVIIVDAVIDEEEEEGRDEYTGARLAMDMTIMSATVNGKERTAGEWTQLINVAGFSKHAIKHMPAIDSVIEAYP